LCWFAWFKLCSTSSCLGHEVIGIDDLSGGYKAFVPKGEKFTFVKLNLERRKKVVELFEEHKPDVLLHFAAYAAEGLSPFIRNYNYRNNLIVSANLINECITYGTKVIFTSSMAVYGEQNPHLQKINAHNLLIHMVLRNTQ
jgi:UDP-glucose 4-epimerase